MYIRFITRFKNEKNQLETGIFSAAEFLRVGDLIFEYDKKNLEQLVKWFSLNLKKPDRLSNSTRKNPANVSLSWFKSSATEHLKQMYAIKEILEKYEMQVDVIKRTNPGYIIYEDDFQISTIPHRADKNKVL